MTPPLLEVRHLRLRRGERLVLSLPALQLARGETLALMGPNGAGKTSLLLALAGLLPLEAGEIYFDGQRLTRRNALALRRRLALVLQAPLLVDASVYDNVALGLRYRRLPRREVQRRASHWLDKLGVAHLANRRAHQLSGGEAQRVSLARAFALEPELLLLDEPFSALDEPTRQRLMADVRNLLRENDLSAILVTHREEEARLLAHRSLRLEAGRPLRGKDFSHPAR